LTYTFILQEDAAFSDGSAITPDVVVDNVNRWLDPESPLRGTGNYETWLAFFQGFLGEKDSDDRPISPVDGVNKIDFSTIVLHLNRPVPDLLVYLADPAFAIVKPESLQDGSYGTINSPIIASGPYQVSSWTSDKLVLTPNPLFWGMAAQVELEFTLR
jgi:ABC-type transport system substrate-binding protein